jgi:hypothetical protein
MYDQSCWTHPDGKSYQGYARQPDIGRLTTPSGVCPSGKNCWYYHPPDDWNGSTWFTAKFNFYARDSDGVESDWLTGRVHVWPE